MSAAYSAIVRSLENFPELAMFRMVLSAEALAPWYEYFNRKQLSCHRLVPGPRLVKPDERSQAAMDSSVTRLTRRFRRARLPPGHTKTKHRLSHTPTVK